MIDAHWRPYEAASFAKGGATLDSDVNSPTHNEQKSTITKKVPSNHGNSERVCNRFPEGIASLINYIIDYSGIMMIMVWHWGVYTLRNSEFP